MSIWSGGRYEAVAERIAPIAAQVVAAVDRRHPLGDAAVADLACGTGSAALAAAAAGAHVTGVDLTSELLAIAARKAGGDAVQWVAADASATGLPGGAFDAVVSNMGIIFVEPITQVAEIARLLRPGGTLGFSSWIRDPDNPFFTPIVEVLGPPPAADYQPDQWAEPDIIRARLATDFDDIAVDSGLHTWQFPSLAAAVHFVTHESPMHLDVLSRVDDGSRARLVDAFSAAFQPHTNEDGTVSFDAPYSVVTARRTG